MQEIKKYENLKLHKDILSNIAKMSKDKYFNGIVPNDVNFMASQGGNILEEASEILKGINSIHERIDGLCDIIVFSVGSMVHTGLEIETENNIEIINSIDTISDALAILFAFGYKKDNSIDIKTFFSQIVMASVNQIERECYNSIKCLNECYLEVSSRLQDPVQKSNGRKPGEKWLKDRTQDIATMHKADYGKCRRA